MIRPKLHIAHIYRTPPIERTRINALRMDKNEFLPHWPDEWFKDFTRRLRPEHLSIHPELGALYKKLSRLLKVSRNNIVITAGSDAGIRSVFEVFLETGDEVIIPSPTFAMYYVYAKIYRARLKEIHYDNELFLDPDKIMCSLSRRTKLVAIANPNSPTGTVIKKEDLLKIIRKASALGAAVLIDEAYYPFYENSMIGFIKEFDNLVVVRTFSKAAGLAGMRIGFLAANRKLAKLLSSVRPMYEITTVSVLLGLYVLDNYERIFEYAAKVRKAKKHLADFFAKKGYEVFSGHANFMHVGFGRERGRINSFLEKNGILFKHDFAHPSLRRFSRFTVGPKESLKPFIEIFNKYKKGRVR